MQIFFGVLHFKVFNVLPRSYGVMAMLDDDDDLPWVAFGFRWSELIGFHTEVKPGHDDKRVFNSEKTKIK